MKTLSLLAFTLASTFATAALAGPGGESQPPTGATAPLDREVAVVEGQAVWQSQIDEVVATIPAKDFDPSQRARILDSLIDTLLVDHQATMLHISIEPAELDAAIATIKQENHVDEAAFQRALVEQGYTLESFRRGLAQQIRGQKVLQFELAQKLAVTDDEVMAEWAKHSKDAPTQEQRDGLKQQILQFRMQQATGEWLAKRRAGAHIEVKP